MVPCYTDSPGSLHNCCCSLGAIFWYPLHPLLFFEWFFPASFPSLSISVAEANGHPLNISGASLIRCPHLGVWWKLIHGYLFCCTGLVMAFIGAFLSMTVVSFASGAWSVFSRILNPKPLTICYWNSLMIYTNDQEQILDYQNLSSSPICFQRVNVRDCINTTDLNCGETVVSSM